MVELSIAIAKLCGLAAENHSTVRERTEARAVIAVTVPNASGRASEPYVVEVLAQEAGQVSVCELPPGLLPKACIERHIDFDGSFCLYWGLVDEIDVETDAGAAEWWRHLIGFLRNQRIADRRRKWPNEQNARAHGTKAACHQALAEFSAQAIGPAFSSELENGTLSLRRNGNRTRLMLDGRRIAGIDRDSKRASIEIAQSHRGEATRLRRLLWECRRMPDALSRFILDFSHRQDAELEFWDFVRKTKPACCGTIDGCPLAATENQE